MLSQERIMVHYSLFGDFNVPQGKFLFFCGGGGLNINVAFRIRKKGIRKKGGYSCLYLIHLGWIAQGWVKITQDKAKFGFRYET